MNSRLFGVHILTISYSDPAGCLESVARDLTPWIGLLDSFVPRLPERATTSQGGVRGQEGSRVRRPCLGTPWHNCREIWIKAGESEIPNQRSSVVLGGVFFPKTRTCESESLGFNMLKMWDLIFFGPMPLGAKTAQTGS